MHLVAVPRKTTKSEILKGYHIPKGSIIFSNMWWALDEVHAWTNNADKPSYMLHDPAVYSDPELFSPERFLETGEKHAELDPRTSAFGFGRR